MSEIKRFKQKTQNAKIRKTTELRISINEAVKLYTEIDNVLELLGQQQSNIEQLQAELSEAKAERVKEVTHEDTSEINIISRAFKIR